jgi:hypothetical protein
MVGMLEYSTGGIQKVPILEIRVQIRVAGEQCPCPARLGQRNDVNIITYHLGRIYILRSLNEIRFSNDDSLAGSYPFADATICSLATAQLFQQFASANHSRPR